MSIVCIDHHEGSSPRVWGTRYSSGHYYDLVGLIPTYAGNTTCPLCASTTTRAHPHVCGEHLPAGQEAMARAGSSPRMRGTLGATRRLMMAGGLIPTYAGNTNPPAGYRAHPEAHPHVCGEHVFSSPTFAAMAGSSPRMRGTPSHRVSYGRPHGLIPTYAGNTSQQAHTGCHIRAHPHVCGEHIPAGTYRVSYPGSSPRMRGTPTRRGSNHTNTGLIPTYAGNTLPPCQLWTPAWAHPHVCGEHIPAGTYRVSYPGSSPRMRGTHPSRHIQGVISGLIPTYAGNTHTPGLQPHKHGAHPHVCGEHIGDTSAENVIEGSSPRMRGTLWSIRPPPAWAGAHPHVCGEHARNAVQVAKRMGSSPRMRGTQ